jgi:lipopolysaccharide transport system permease protein
MILVYTVIFSQIMRAKLPDIAGGVNGPFAYSIYLCAGVLTWAFFSETVTRAQNVFLENANLIKKISFPRLCLPVIVVANASLNFAIIFGLFTLFLLVSGSFPGLPYLAVFPVLLVQVLFAVGLGMTLGVLNVFFRDVGQLFGVVIQFWFWLTPIVYPITILPENIRYFIDLNPLTTLTAAYQNILVYTRWPDWGTLWPIGLVAVVLCLWCLRLFRRRSGEIVDEL